MRSSSHVLAGGGVRNGQRLIVISGIDRVIAPQKSKKEQNKKNRTRERKRVKDMSKVKKQRMARGAEVTAYGQHQTFQ